MTAYPRMIEILQLLGSSSFLITPSEADFSGPLTADIEQYLATDNTSARDRVKLFRLAWDVAGNAFGSRQVLYERFFASDPLTRARALAAIYPKGEVMERVLEFLHRDDTRRVDMEDMSMSNRPMYLGHVNVYVRNVERSRQWYEDLLGLHIYQYRPGCAAFMSADKDKSHEVALMQVGDDAPLQQKRQVGLNHMACLMEIARRSEGLLSPPQGEGQSSRPHLRSRHLARHLFPRSRRQRRRGVLRIAAREVAAPGQRVRSRRDQPGPVPGTVGRGDREAARRRTGRVGRKRLTPSPEPGSRQQPGRARRCRRPISPHMIRGDGRAR